MAVKRYDLVAVTGTYTDHEGVEKRRFMNCGVVFEGEKGLSLKLEAVPVNSDGWFYLFEPRQQQGTGAAPPQQPQRRPARAQAALLDDDPPF